jgi:hypothetical protein
MPRLAILLVLLTLGLAALGLTAGPAFATVYEDSSQFFYGWLSPGQGADGPYDSQLCGKYGTGTGAAFSGYGWATVTLIDGGGGWHATVRDSVSGGTNAIGGFLNPNNIDNARSFNKKSYCLNSGTGEQVLLMTCVRYFWVDTSIHCA